MADSFIHSWLEYAEKQESPTLFHWWAAVTTIATAAGRKSWFPFGVVGSVFPNHYVILCGPSGVGKNLPITLCEKLLNRAFAENKDYLVLSGEITAPALSKILGQNLRKMVIHNKAVDTSRAALFASSELGRLLSQRAQREGMPNYLIELYDCGVNAPYYTKTSGIDFTPYPYFNLIGGTTPTWISSNINPNIMGEGFAGRVIFVYADKIKEKISLKTLISTGNNEEIFETMVHFLREIANCYGQFEMSPETLDFLDNWYMSRPDLPETSILKTCGFDRREPIHVIKLAMINSLATLSFPHIYTSHVKAAIELIAETKKGVELILAPSEATPEAQHNIRILNYIARMKRPVSERELKQFMYKHVGSMEQLNQAIDLLVQSGMLAAKARVNANKSTTILYNIPQEDVITYDTESLKRLSVADIVNEQRKQE